MSDQEDVLASIYGTVRSWQAPDDPGSPARKKTRTRSKDDPCPSCARLAPYDWAGYRPCGHWQCLACAMMNNTGASIGHGRCPVCDGVTSAYKVTSSAVPGAGVVVTGAGRAAAAALATEAITEGVIDETPAINVPVAALVRGNWVPASAQQSADLLPHIIVSPHRPPHRPPHRLPDRPPHRRADWLQRNRERCTRRRRPRIR